MKGNGKEAEEEGTEGAAMVLRQETWREPSPATPHIKDWAIPDPF